jgi:hypothetical protein
MLSKSGAEVNDLSPQLRKILDDAIADQGKYVIFKFKIAKPNPEYNFMGSSAAIDSEIDISRAPGPKLIWPAWWDLQPVTYRIIDPGDKRRKKIGIVTQEDDAGNPVGFKRCSLREIDMGRRKLDMDNPDDVEMFMYLFMHPLLVNGMFKDKNSADLIEIVNEAADAKKRGKRRSVKADAMYVANNMTDREMKDYACAKGWDEEQDPEILQDLIGADAEGDPDIFKTFMESSNFPYRAEITRAEKAGVIYWLPMENKYTWSNGQVITAFGLIPDIDRLKEMAEWLISNKQGDEIFKRIKTLNRPKKIVQPAEEE